MFNNIKSTITILNNGKSGKCVILQRGLIQVFPLFITAPEIIDNRIRNETNIKGMKSVKNGIQNMFIGR